MLLFLKRVSAGVGDVARAPRVSRVSRASSAAFQVKLILEHSHELGASLALAHDTKMTIGGAQIHDRAPQTPGIDRPAVEDLVALAPERSNSVADVVLASPDLFALVSAIAPPCARHTHARNHSPARARR